MAVTASPRPRSLPARTPSPAGRRRTRWAARGLVAGGAALVPWAAVLAVRLPETARVSNWALAWAGLDAVIATGLVATGTLLARGDERHALTAAATGAVLVMDAWFDVATSGEGGRAGAVALAAGVELPAAAVCAALAVRGLRQEHIKTGETECKETDETWRPRPLE